MCRNSGILVLWQITLHALATYLLPKSSSFLNSLVMTEIVLHFVGSMQERIKLAPSRSGHCPVPGKSPLSPGNVLPDVAVFQSSFSWGLGSHQTVHANNVISGGALGHTQHQRDFQRDCRLNLAVPPASGDGTTPHTCPGPQGSGEFPRWQCQCWEKSAHPHREKTTRSSCWSSLD